MSGVIFGQATVEEFDTGAGAQQGAAWNDGLVNPEGEAWFDPIAVLRDNDPTGDSYRFWSCMCGGVWLPELIPLQQIDDQSQAPDYPCMTAFGIASYGLCAVGRAWLWSIFWSQRRGLPERNCNLIDQNPPEG